MKYRLKDMFSLAPAYREPRVNDLPPDQYLVVGEPVDVAGARAWAAEDKYQFQYWALSLLGARPRERKYGRDRGVDGIIFFIDGPNRARHKVVIQVNGGGADPGDVRDLKGTVEREGASLGLFITLEEPTRDMGLEATSGDFFHSDLMNRDYSRFQIRTVEDLLEGRTFEMPPRPVQFPQAQRVPRREGTQPSLLDRPA